MKDRIRRWIFNLIGYPTDVQNLLNYIDSFDGDICIYPGGEFHFGAHTSDGKDMEPIVFPTPQERASFTAGLNYGVSLMGGQTVMLSDEQLKEYQEMENLSSVRGDPKKVN